MSEPVSTAADLEHVLEVLLVEDDAEDAQLLRALVNRPGGETQLRFTVVERLSEAIARLEARPFDVIALDLSLPDAQGMTGLRTLRAAAPDVPVVVVTGLADQPLAHHAITLGAQDYIVKGTTDGTLLLRSLRYAIERHRVERERDNATFLLRQHTDQLLAANAELSHAADARDELLAMVSHELRTPLTPIVGFTQILRTRLADRLDDQEIAMIEAIGRNAKRMQEHVDQLLNVSYLHRPAHAATAETTPVDVVVRDAVQQLIDDQFDTREQIISTVPDDLRVTIPARHFDQILSNLLVNAKKYGTPPVEVTATSEAGHAHISVRDHGDGVPEAFAPHLFDRFSQASTGTRRTSSGVGLGLYLARQLARLHGGDLVHESSPEQSGAQFSLTLPLTATSPDSATAPPGSDAPEAFAAHTAEAVARRLQVAADEVEVARILESAINDLGGAVVPFGDAGDDLLPIDVSLGLSGPMAPIPSGPDSRVQLERLLPRMIEDARAALHAVRARATADEFHARTARDDPPRRSSAV